MIRSCHGTREREVKLWVLGNGLRGEIHCRGRNSGRGRRGGGGRREGGVVEMRVAAHFSQQTKTFAGISIWSHEAVFPSCPIIHHLSVLTTTWALHTPPPPPPPPPQSDPPPPTHMHTPLPSVFLPHSWPGTHEHFLRPLAITQNKHKHTGCNAYLKQDRKA